MDDPTEEFVRMAISDVYEGRFTAAIREQFAPMVKNAWREIVRDLVQSRISSALATTNVVEMEPVEVAKSADEDEVVTTEEEKEGFMIVGHRSRSHRCEPYPPQRCPELLCYPDRQQQPATAR